MALTDITLNDGQGTPAAHVFTFIKSDTNGRVIRSELAANPEEPLIMTHAHTNAKRNGVNVTSHLFRIDKTVLDSDGVTPLTANIRLMCDTPIGIISDALADDFAAYIRNWASSANVRAWLKGSVG